MVAGIVYDGARLFAVHVLGLMGDFHPRDGVVRHSGAGHRGQWQRWLLWSYIGDADGLGVAFFVVAYALGIDRW